MSNRTAVVFIPFFSLCLLFCSLCLAQPNDPKVVLAPCVEDSNASSAVFFHPNRWRSDIEKFKKEDANSFPPKHAVLFVGSSSIRLWKLNRSFPDIITINRGFGGSYISDSLYYADKIILPYEPNKIVFYAGDNDVTDGKTPSMLLSQIKSLEQKIHAALPDTEFIYISIKPSIARWHLWSCMKQTNDLIADYCSKTRHCKFVDVSEVMLNGSGMPSSELFEQDGLHLNYKGYELWTKLLRPYLN